MVSDDGIEQAWGRLVQLLFSRRTIFLAMSRELGLTPPQTHALMTLSDGPARMGSMADAMVCDASYITSIVDRLEELGLAERQPSTTDRRVKEVVLTAAGRQAVARLHQAMFEPPAALHQLSVRDRNDLVRIAQRLVPDDSGPPRIDVR
ncbi:MAG: MarR family transcriptional regulator [Acidimicrobiia bacterium]|nr:MarR family transcriptional regulator [Acidimicrobiia bacterium]